MKLSWISGSLFAIALAMPAIPASGQIGVYIGVAPPPVRVERRGPLPGPGYAWVDGYWSPNGGRYQWVAGRWDRPPYEGASWNRPRYVHSRKGWQLQEGHWNHANHGHDRDHHDH